MRSILLAGLLLPSLGFSATLEFKRNGKPVKSFTAEELRAGTLGPIKAEEVDLHNAWRGYRKTYVGFDLLKTLDAVYGKTWRRSKMVKFVATDGYLSHSNTKPMLAAAKGKKGLIAYKEKGLDGFTPAKKGDKDLDLGPFYLVWSNFSDKDKAKYSDLLKWPYQLQQIDVAD